MEEENDKLIKRYEELRESYSNMVSHLQYTNYKVEELVNKVKLLEDRKNEKRIG